MITKYFLNMIAGNVMHSTSVAALPPTYYVALSTAMPTNDEGAGFTEVSGGAYTRGTFGVSAEPVDGMAANAVDIEFPECTANWGTVKAFGLYDAASGGHLLSWDALKTEQTIVAGNQVRFKPGTLKITFAKKTGSR